MLGMNWLKRKLKTKMTPLEHAYARKMTQRLSLLYAFIGWNFVSILLYFTFKEHIPDGPGKTQKYIEIMNIPYADVIEFSGFSKVKEYKVDRIEEYLEIKKKSGDLELLVEKDWTPNKDSKSSSE